MKRPSGRQAERGPFGRMAAAVPALTTVAVAVAALAPLAHPWWPMAAVAEHFALQVLMAALLAAFLAILFRRWRWLGAALAIAAIEAAVIHPYWPAFDGGTVAAVPATGERTLKLVSFNLWYRNADYAAVRDYLQASGADIIGLVEATPRWKTELAGLRATYPYAIDCIGDSSRCEEMLLSKLPFVRGGAGRAGGRFQGGLPTVIWAEIASQPDGLPDAAPMLTVALTHLARPTIPDGPHRDPAIDPDLPRIAQAEQARNLAGALGREPFADAGNLVLMGDFNAAPWSRIQRALRVATGLDDRGFLTPTWPAWGPSLIRLPIDHVLVRGRIRLLAMSPGPALGSDHLPVVATVAVPQP